MIIYNQYLLRFTNMFYKFFPYTFSFSFSFKVIFFPFTEHIF